MSDAFHTAIGRSLADQNLQAALDANAARRTNAQQTAFASLPEPLETMRQRAHQVRAHTIAHLDQYLNEFITNAQANGMIVHRAAGAAQAQEIVLGIARERNARLVAKSKTMVSEEIHLNHILEQAGLRVVETDLGEYIVQLRGEPPAHIITPAVHLRRGDVGRTFQQKLGIPYTEDVSTMTAVARRNLRQVFLEADIGISGVNFGVAESGTLCIVTNEGNGRMVTTVPPVHIALMGMERLVPTLDDLALMLYLLPRSATGQKITVYTTLINAPRRPGELDGAEERHLILLDNGRSRMRNSPLNDALLCIRCGACMNACPVFRELGGHAYVGAQGDISIYPGPIGSIVSPGLFGQAEFGHLARASSLCGACQEACPVDIDLPKLLLRVRAGGLDLKTERPPKKVPASVAAGLRLYTWAATRPGLFAFGERLAGVISRLAAPFSDWLRLPAFTGWGFGKDLPRPAARPFRARFKEVAAAGNQAAAHGGKPDEASSLKGVKTSPREAPEPTTRELVERFSAELASLGGSISVCSSDRLAGQVVNILTERGNSELLAWEQAHLPAGLIAALREAGISVGHQVDPDCKVGLTGAVAAIAETGTVILPAGPGRLQSASLMPEVHLVVLHAADILADLPQGLNHPEVRSAGAINLISGPSRTADIEMTLTIGVHGPGEVHVFCLDDT
jgi:L-lactate dehydrogenase complex protein LldF